MTYEALETQIQALLAEAAPLRLLDEDDPRMVELAAIVNQVNSLRAKQSTLTQQAELAVLMQGNPNPMDRGWLERKAADLGIAFRANISDENLAKRIADHQTA